MLKFSVCRLRCSARSAQLCKVSEPIRNEDRKLLRQLRRVKLQLNVDFDFSRLVAKVPWLEERFHSATLPAEGGEIERTKRSLESTAEFRKLQELDALERGERRASEESDLSNMSEAERTRVKLQTQKKLRNMLSARLKQRSSISYNDGAELDLPIVYLLTRMAPNYAAIYRVLSEVSCTEV